MAESRLLGMADIKKATTLSRASIYRYIHNGEFPKQVKLGPGRVGWHEADVLKWMASLEAPDGEKVASRETPDGKKVANRGAPDGKKPDSFTLVAQKLASGELKGEIILGGRRRLRMLRTDERVEIRKTGESD